MTLSITMYYFTTTVVYAFLHAVRYLQCVCAILYVADGQANTPQRARAFITPGWCRSPLQRALARQRAGFLPFSQQQQLLALPWAGRLQLLFRYGDVSFALRAPSCIRNRRPP